MKSSHVVWRTLADHVFELGHRQWPTIRSLAIAAGVETHVAARALRPLRNFGAVAGDARRGVRTLSPTKIIALLATSRDLRSDLVTTTTVAGARGFTRRFATRCTIGGPEAAIVHLGNSVEASHAPFTRILYAPPALIHGDLPAGDELLLLDDRALAQQNPLPHPAGYTSVSQTYADLFALPDESLDPLRIDLFAELCSIARV